MPFSSCNSVHIVCLENVTVQNVNVTLVIVRYSAGVDDVGIQFIGQDLKQSFL